MAFHILVVEHSENFNSTKRIWSATPYALTGANPLLLAAREHFELLDVSPGTSSDNLATPGSPRVSMLTPSPGTKLKKSTCPTLINNHIGPN